MITYVSYFLFRNLHRGEIKRADRFENLYRESEPEEVSCVGGALFYFYAKYVERVGLKLLL